MMAFFLLQIYIIFIDAFKYPKYRKKYRAINCIFIYILFPRRFSFIFSEVNLSPLWLFTTIALCEIKSSIRNNSCNFLHITLGALSARLYITSHVGSLAQTERGMQARAAAATYCFPYILAGAHVAAENARLSFLTSNTSTSTYELPERAWFTPPPPPTHMRAANARG